MSVEKQRGDDEDSDPSGDAQCEEVNEPNPWTNIATCKALSSKKCVVDYQSRLAGFSSLRCGHAPRPGRHKYHANDDPEDLIGAGPA